MKFTPLVLVASALAIVPGYVFAQAPSSTSSAAPAINTSIGSVPVCSLTCTIANAANSSCGGISNLTCLCTNIGFQTTVQRCFAQRCNTTDLAAALLYGNYTCAAIGYPVNITLPLNGTNGTNATTNGTMMRRGVMPRRSTVQVIRNVDNPLVKRNDADPATRLVQGTFGMAAFAAIAGLALL